MTGKGGKWERRRTVYETVEHNTIRIRKGRIDNERSAVFI